MLNLANFTRWQVNFSKILIFHQNFIAKLPIKFSNKISQYLPINLSNQPQSFRFLILLFISSSLSQFPRNIFDCSFSMRSFFVSSSSLNTVFFRWQSEINAQHVSHVSQNQAVESARFLHFRSNDDAFFEGSREALDKKSKYIFYQH